MDRYRTAMTDPADEARIIAADIETLRQMGYRQELVRRMSGFSNYAVSLSIICILAGGVTSFHQGLCSVGGASIGLGWPAASLLALAFAATMGQVASAFPTAGGLYHWASILGDRGWGWVTAWFNLAGLITVLAAVNVGAYQFTFQALGPWLGYDPATAFRAGPNRSADRSRRGHHLLAGAVQSLGNSRHDAADRFQRLLDSAGRRRHSPLRSVVRIPAWISAAWSRSPITAACRKGDARLARRPSNLPWLFALGFMLPLYTITGFDASAHTAEETVGAAHHVPRAIVRSVVVSGVVRLGDAGRDRAGDSQHERGGRPGRQRVSLDHAERFAPLAGAAASCVGIAIAQYLCGLATVTSASRMAYAFARDGGLPWSRGLRRVEPALRLAGDRDLGDAALAIAFTIYTPIYSTLATSA